MPLVNPTLPNDGESADAADISGPFGELLAVFNGHIGSDNIEPGTIQEGNLNTALVNKVANIGVYSSVLTHTMTADDINDASVDTRVPGGQGCIITLNHGMGSLPKSATGVLISADSSIIFPLPFNMLPPQGGWYGLPVIAGVVITIAQLTATQVTFRVVIYDGYGLSFISTNGGPLKFRLLCNM